MAMLCPAGNDPSLHSTPFVKLQTMPPKRKKLTKKEEKDLYWENIFAENAERKEKWEERKQEIKAGNWEPPSPDAKTTFTDDCMKARAYQPLARNLNYDWDAVKPPKATWKTVPSLSRLCAVGAFPSAPLLSDPC